MGGRKDKTLEDRSCKHPLWTRHCVLYPHNGIETRTLYHTVGRLQGIEVSSGKRGASIVKIGQTAAWLSCSLIEVEGDRPEKVLELCRLAMMPKISPFISKGEGSHPVVLSGVVVIVSDALILKCKVM